MKRSVLIWCIGWAIKSGAHEFMANRSDLGATWIGKFYSHFERKRTCIYAFKSDDANFVNAMNEMKESRTTDGDLPFW